MGYIWQKLWNKWSNSIDNFLGCIRQKLWDILCTIVGYIGQKLWDILWDIFVKSYGIYLTKNEGYIG